MVRVLLVAIAAIACGTGSSKNDQRAFDAGRDLVGTWDARLSLNQPYPLGHDEPVARRICGTISFVENHSSAAELDLDTPQDLGVFDLDLSRLGLDWLGDAPFPIAVASVPSKHDTRAGPPSSDSVTIVLKGGSQERIVLRGGHDIDGIRGDWTAQSARGVATGSFSLRPRTRVPDSCR